MAYLVQINIEGVGLCCVCDQNDKSREGAEALYRELAAAVPIGYEPHFDAILGAHGCTRTGKGFLLCQVEGLMPCERPDGTMYVRVNGIEHDIVNPGHVPEISTGLVGGDVWTLA